MATFGAWLKQRRASLDLRQEELAEGIHCSVITIQKMEAGERRPSRQIAELLVEYLQVPLDERAAFIRFARQDPSTPIDTPESAVRPSPWRTLYSRFSNAPAEPSELIGRQQEVQAVLDLLRRDGVRMVTLTGPPGIGKTRLSLQIASELFADFEDGTTFVGLARISQADQVAAAIAETLGVREVSHQDLAQSLREALRDKRQLLLLDNYEHVLPAASLVGELLKTCRWLKVLVTSRAALHVQGEYQFLVPPLALPDLTRPAAAEQIASIPSVTLFVSRAQAVNRVFSLTDDNAVMVGVICTRLDGLPLAIELAAARLNLLSLQNLQGQLEDRFVLLKDSALDVPERHQTLHNAIAWSYNLLNTSEQALFARMAVFVNGATLDAIEAIANATGDLAMHTVDIVVSLLDKSLLQRYQPAAAEAEPRLVMLETIWAFARETLAERPESSAIHRLHAEYYLALAEAAEGSLHGPEQHYWLDRLESEHDNLRSSLAWCAASPDRIELGLRLACAMGEFWHIRFHLSEGRSWLSRLLAPGNGSEALRASAFYHAAELASLQADYAQATRWVESSLALYTALGDPHGKAKAYWSLGGMALYERAFERARAYLETSLELHRAIGAIDSVPHILSDLALVIARQADYGRAIVLFEECLALLREVGDSNEVATTIQRLAVIVRIQGNFQRTCNLLKDSLRRSQELDSPGHVIVNHIELADTVLALGDYAQATDHFEQSLELARALGMNRETAYSLFGLGDVAFAQAEFVTATNCYEAGLPLLRAIGDLLALAWGLRRLGRLALAEGDSATAHSHYAESLALCRTINYAPGLSKAALGLGKVAWHRQDTASARTYFADALQLQRKISNPYDVAAMLDAVGTVAARQDLLDHAVQLLGAANALRSRMGVVLHIPERSAHESLVIQLTQQLTPARFSQRWEAGQSLTLQDAISLTLGVVASHEPQPDAG